MTEAEVMFVIGISALALWKRNLWLYLGTCISLVLFAWQVAETSWTYAIPIIILAAYMLGRSIADVWR
jgi:uncharacterized membrane protein